MTKVHRRLAGDCGETLIEVIIAMLILGIVFVAILAGLGTSIATSLFHKKQATAQTIARDFGEYMQFTASYHDCGSAADYSTDVDNFKSAYALPDGSHPLTGGSPTYAVSITGLSYWDGNSAPAAFVGSCSTDKGAQRFTLNVTTSSGTRITDNVVEVLQVVKRKS